MVLSAIRRYKSVTTTILIAACLSAASADAADDLTRPVRVSENGRFLARPDGKPFFWLGDTAWPLVMRLDRAETDSYLEDRAQKGFTVIQAVAYGGPWDGIGKPNRYGELPLIANDPARPNPRYFELVDWLIDRGAHHGLRIALLPVWALEQINGFAQAALSESANAGAGKRIPINPANAEAYGRWLGNRYKDKGVIWVLGGDALPVWPQDASKPGSPLIDHRPIYDAMAKGIIETVGKDAFITYHSCGLSFSGAARPRTSLYFHDRVWLSMNMLQSSHFADPASFFNKGTFDFGWDARRNYEPVRDEYESSPTRPVIDGETRYEDEPIDVTFDERKGFWKAFDSRNAAYHAVFAGAAGHTYGNNSVHQFFDPAHNPPLEWVKSPWQKEIHSLAAGQMRHVKDLMLSRPYFTRVPDQSVLKSDAGSGDDYISATRDRDGSYAMVYSPKGRSFVVDLTKVSGSRAVGWWFNPRTGAATAIKSEFPTQGTLAFTPPTKGPEDDWVLVLDDETRRLPPPGNKL